MLKLSGSSFAAMLDESGASNPITIRIKRVAILTPLFVLSETYERHHPDVFGEQKQKIIFLSFIICVSNHR
jgi:hypothetical protein